MKANVSGSRQALSELVLTGAQDIKNIKAYSENTGLDVLAALHGQYEQLDGVFHVSVLPPCESLNGGPSEGVLYTLAFDMNRTPYTLKHMVFQGVSPITGAFRFAG